MICVRSSAIERRCRCRTIAIVRLPFTHKYAAPLWLALRLYVAWIFFQMGLGKLQSGWLVSDPVGELLKLVANGTLPIPFAFYRTVAQLLIGAGVTGLISHSMPLLELAIALSLASGVLTPVAAVGALGSVALVLYLAATRDQLVTLVTVLAALYPAIPVVLNGSDVDALHGSAEGNTWNVTGPGNGKLNNVLTFATVENLAGGSLNDTFTFRPRTSVRQLLQLLG